MKTTYVKYKQKGLFVNSPSLKLGQTSSRCVNFLLSYFYFTFYHTQLHIRHLGHLLLVFRCHRPNKIYKNNCLPLAQ